MEISFTLDLVVTAIIIVTFSVRRFDSWPNDPPLGVIGKPIDYISVKSFIAYFTLYVLSVTVLMLALRGIPGLSQLSAFRSFFDGLGIPNNSKMYTIWAFAAVSLASVPPLEKYENEWRNKLHLLARIPRDVLELRNSLSSIDRFTPPEYYLNITKEEIIKAGKELQPQFKSLEQKWLEYLQNFNKEKEQRSIYWHFLNCLTLLVVAKVTCNNRILGPTQQTERRILELGSFILSLDNNKDQELIQELDQLSDHFEICICKSIVKKYPSITERYKALESLGFRTNHHDHFKPKLFASLLHCVIGVSFCSILSVVLILFVLENSGPTQITSERFFSWSLGSFLSFSVAIFVAAFIAAQKNTVNTLGIITSTVMCVFFSTLASAIYFIVVRDLNAISENQPIARITLALSFAMLSPFVYLAIVKNALDRAEIFRFVLYQGFVLGILLMILQCAVSYTFNFNQMSYASIHEFFTTQNNKMLYMAMIGFFKGFFLGAFISYIIQNTKRAQLLKSLRNHPRAEVVIPINLPAESSPAIALDISANGLKLETQTQYKPGDKLQFDFRHSGKVEGFVKWTKRKARGRYLIGIFIPQETLGMQIYLREHFGSHFA